MNTNSTTMNVMMVTGASPQNTQTTAGDRIPACNDPAALSALTNNHAEPPGKDNIIMHDAEIITPQPYGVYALCKIIEHLQNN